ncbi:hypothetical protein Gogos_003141 [Gossypium gossypioides]|uniref:Uncharacterized protein n=1 Tax=Gossypium gossypioides TaxID=34282 RepID=A0A7J9CKY6_GOSGO|nr:hypothetical protein [Gossypium gossypioides]
MFPSELKSRRSNPFVVKNVFLYGTIEVTHPDFDTFKINNHRLKLYFCCNVDNERKEFHLQDPP